MKPQNLSSSNLTAENDTTIFVSIELSRKSWLIGVHTPLADKIGLHKIEAGDSASLLTLIRQLSGKVARMTGTLVTVLSCYEAGYVRCP